MDSVTDRQERGRIDVREEAELGVPADVAWELVGDFVALPAALAETFGADVKFEGEGTELSRRISLNGETVVEKREAHDDANRRTSYSMVAPGPFPIANYFATVEVTPRDGERCSVAWTSTFDPVGVSDEVAATTVRKLYRDAIAFLQGHFGS